MNLEESIRRFKSDLRVKDPRWIYQKYLLGHDVWYFREYLNHHNYAEFYDDLKILMSERLDIHTNDIAIVGSAKLGFSISPKTDKAFRIFSEESDLDIAIVSYDLFRKSWDAFLDLSQKGYLPYYQSITSNIFRRFVMLKSPSPKNHFFREWSGKVDPCKKDLQTIFSINHEINYRIYESWGAVEQYHCAGLDKLKEILGSE